MKGKKKKNFFFVANEMNVVEIHQKPYCVNFESISVVGLFFIFVQIISRHLISEEWSLLIVFYKILPTHRTLTCCIWHHQPLFYTMIVEIVSTHSLRQWASIVNIGYKIDKLAGENFFSMNDVIDVNINLGGYCAMTTMSAEWYLTYPT